MELFLLRNPILGTLGFACVTKNILPNKNKIFLTSMAHFYSHVSGDKNV
ncbi:MAG: hypothetical protein J1G30_01715 [Spirochaetales bacterium]|nr:hypothetical protein [Spirochaetales bacterium]